jgi:hypothetical protein
MDMHNIDPKLVVQIFQFLWTMYSSRRASTKPIPDSETKEQPTASVQIPNPDKLKELIKDVQKNPEQTEGSISAAIDRRFTPSEAQQVKDDFAAYTVLVSPPDFADYDFTSAISRYLKGMQAIALTADLFRIRGKKIGSTRILAMPDSGAAFIPQKHANSLVYPIGRMISASVAPCQAKLTDEKGEVPLIVVVRGTFTYASSGIPGGERNESREMVYRFRAGQESNWLLFYRADESQYVPFRDFEYRLNASNARDILTALKKDIVTYLRDLQEEQPLLSELRQELEGVTRIITPKQS